MDARDSIVVDERRGPAAVMLGGAAGTSPGGDDLLTVTVVRDEHGYGMKVSGDNPVYVQSVKEHGAAWRAGLRAGDRILCVDCVPVQHHAHQQVVHMIRANPSTALTVQQNSSRLKTPITAPVPVNSEKQRQLEVTKAHTVRLMLEQEQKYIRELKNELLKVPDVRKQAQLESSEQRCSILQHEIDNIIATQPEAAPSTPKLSRKDPERSNSGFLSALPRSLSNLTGQSLRGLRQRARGEPPPPLPMPLPLTTCLDNTPPPLPPRRAPLPSPALTPAPAHTKHKKPHPMHRSAPAYGADKFRRSSHSLDGEPDGPQPNSIALQLNYPLVNVPPPSLLTDNRSGIPILHVRSQSSPEHLDHEAPRTSATPGDKEWWARGTPPPGTPPPPYHQPAQPCADPQRAIISMEEDESPASDTSTHSGLFSNLRSVRESRARTAVLINWLLAERRCACAGLLLLLTDAYRAAPPPARSLRRWAYEIHSTFLMPGAVLQLNGVDENMANEIEHVLVNEHDKEELLRNVFRKARRRAKEELSRQLGEFQVKRQVGLATLYGPDDAVLQRCDLDKQQELVVVERIMCGRLGALAAGGTSAGAAGAVGGCGGAGGAEAHAALLAALVAAAQCLQCRPACVAAAAGGARASFLQRDKLYKQRLKQIAKQQPQPFVVRGHHLQLQALTSVGHCHHCDHVIWGLAPQAYVCSDCKLRVHRGCARAVEEGCCLDGEHSNNRISRFMERIHPQPPGQDSSDKKSRKSSGTAHFLNMERSFRKMEDEPPPGDGAPTAGGTERRDESDESLYESADCHSDAISASDDALPRLGKTPTMSKESLKLAVTDEEGDLSRFKKGHRKAMSLSNPLEIVKTLGDEWLDHKQKETEKNSDKKKSRESLWSEEDRESIYGSSMKLDKIRKLSKKEDKSSENSRKSSTTEAPKRKTSKVSSVSALNFLRRKKTPTSMKAVEAVVEVVDGIFNTDEILNRTKFFLEEEKRLSSVSQSKPVVETDSDEEMPPPKVIGEHRRRLSRQTSRSKSKVRGKSQSVKVNTLRKTHSGTLKKGKKKNGKNSLTSRSRQASIVDQSPILKKKSSDSSKQNSWLFSGSKGDARREGSTEEQTAPDADADDAATREPEKENNCKGATGGVNRAESCRERDAPRRWKHRNASDPNRLTAHHKHDLEPGAATAPSGSSSSSSLSSRSNESNTVVAEQQASQSDWSEEEDPLAAQWSESLPPHLRDSLVLSARIRKRQEVIHELIVSEGSHVRWLKVLGVDFLKPLERQPSLLPVDELRALFPNLPGVTNRHVKLYADLRTVRNEAPNHVVQIGPLADAMLNTLGEAGYAQSLSRFCRGQRMALDTLRERRRKNKDLQALLAAREQLPRCGRLQLRDLLACVWQRLTKYQLLLDSILRTVVEESEEDGAEEVARLRCALTVAKEVLHSVDTAIRTAENEHRLRSIQAKLEVRGAECEELRRLDLTAHSLRHEGELALRTDNKRTAVLALLLRDCLVLLQREGERYVLRPAQTGHAAPLSPLIKWDKVLFRPNAAVKNTFFLMNINGIQMHELSANTAAEYATWVRLIQEAPLARLAEAKPAHAHSRSTDDSGVNVSRNPSDASEKSTSSAPPTCENERDISLERDDKQDIDKPVLDIDENGDKRLSEKDEDKERERSASVEKEEKYSGPAVGSSSTHTAPPPALNPPAALTVRQPQHAHLATRAYSHHERLRRLDEDISRALKAKSAVVAELLGVPAHSYTHLAELAVADTLGQVDICGELPSSREPDAPADLHQLLLAAQAQANQLTESLSGAMSASEAARVVARSGRCDTCARRRSSEVLEESDRDSRVSCRAEADSTYDMLADLSQEPSPDALLEGETAGCPLLAARLAGGVCGLQSVLAALLAALPAVERERRELREELAVLRERLDARRADNHTKEDNVYTKGNLDQSLQEQPSNGG